MSVHYYRATPILNVKRPPITVTRKKSAKRKHVGETTLPKGQKNK